MCVFFFLPACKLFQKSLSMFRFSIRAVGESITATLSRGVKGIEANLIDLFVGFEDLIGRSQWRISFFFFFMEAVLQTNVKASFRSIEWDQLKIFTFKIAKKNMKK